MPEKLNWNDETLGYYSWDIIENRVVLDAIAAEMYAVDVELAAEGVPVETILGMIDEVTRRRVAKAIFDCLTTGKFYDEEYPVSNSHGEVRWLKVVGRIVMADNNEPLKAIGAIRDITEYRRMAE